MKYSDTGLFLDNRQLATYAYNCAGGESGGLTTASA